MPEPNIMEDPGYERKVVATHPGLPLNPPVGTAAEAHRPYVHWQVDRLDQTITNLYETVGRMEDRLGQVLRQDIPNAIMPDSEKVAEAPPDVPLGSRISSITLQAETTLVHLQSLIERLEV